MSGKATKTHIDKVWQTFDYNNNGILSLAEIDRAVIDVFPQYAKDKPAILRAYKAADASKDGFIDRKEFGKLIDFLGYYDDLFKKFSKIDTDGDRRVSFDEFKKGWSDAGFSINEGDTRKTFDAIDKNKGGYILFEEFCGALAKKKLSN
ncbi:hypothetical protein SpCBS45565_g06573 [Spizellomyces sp. 'palustris']|nr:hypothetical protein SpCBS45565_g06573 [Spizellomyces sp. 'palustris']